MDASQLKQIPLFADASDEELAKVAAFAESKEIAEGHPAVTEGGFSRELLAIEEGTAEVTRDGEHIADLGPGDFFGEMALLGDTVRNADVISSSPMTAMVMTDSAFRSLARRMPDVAEEIRAACRRRTEELASGG